MSTNTFAQAGNQVSIPGVNAPSTPKTITSDFRKSESAEGITTASGISQADKEKAVNYAKSKGYDTKDSINDYVKSEYGGDASKFFSDVSSSQAQTEAETFKSTDSVIAREFATAKKENVDTGENIEADREKAIAEAEAQKESDLAREAQFAEENENIITSQSDDMAEIEEQKRQTAEDQKDANLELLKEKEQNAIDLAETERVKLEAEAEYQKAQNEQLIVQAEANIDIERQKSAWAYQKIGLGFSSGVINQSQQIATDGIAQIAEIKAKMNYEEALVGVQHSQITAEIKGIELEYTGMINDTINIYSDKLDDLDESAITRMHEVEKNLLINNQEKKEAEDTILKDYRKEQQELEKQHMADMQEVKDRGLEYTVKIADQIEKEQTISKDKVDMSISTGGWFNESQVQKEKMLREAGLSASDGKAMENKIVGDSIVEKVSSMMPEDFSIDPDTKLKLRNEVNNLLDLGYTLDNATDKATAKVMKDSPEYKAMKEKEAGDDAFSTLQRDYEELQMKVATKELNAQLNPVTYPTYSGVSSGGSSSSSGGSTSKNTSSTSSTKKTSTAKTNNVTTSTSNPGLNFSVAPSENAFDWRATARARQTVEEIKAGKEPVFDLDNFMNN